MSEQKSKTKKLIKKSATAKKTPVKKAAIKNAASGNNKASIKTAVANSKIDSGIVPTIQAIVGEMNKDRETRDKQLSALIQEVRDGFSTLSEKTNEQAREHDKEMTTLYQSLHNAFGKIKDGNSKSEERNLSIYKSLSDSIMMDHEQTLKEVHEQEKLQDKKLKNMDKVQQQRTSRNRLIAVPGVIIAIIGIFYMFYVVSIMEIAMTSMSQDMHKVQLSVGNMSDKIDTISQDTTAMNSNIRQLNINTNQMSRDLNVMTNNVAPAMKGMRDVMPWAP